MSFPDGIKAIKARNYHLAAYFFREIVNEDDSNHKAWNALGFVNTKLGNYKEAAICYQKALLLAPGTIPYERNKEKNDSLIKNKPTFHTLPSNDVNDNVKSINQHSLNIIQTSNKKEKSQIGCDLEQQIAQYLKIKNSVENSPKFIHCPLCGKNLKFSSMLYSKKLCDNCYNNLDEMKEKINQTLYKQIDSLNKVTPNEKKYLHTLEVMEKEKILLQICRKKPEIFYPENKYQIHSFFHSIGIDINEHKFIDFYSEFIQNYFSKKDELPIWIGYLPNGINPALSKNEIIHYMDNVVYKEPVIKKLKYGGMSHGFSFRIVNGVSYRIGTHGGEAERIESFEEVGKGYLFLTNTRLQFIPINGNKHANIPLNKIASFIQYSDGIIDIHKSGREKPFRFIFSHKKGANLMNFCLSKIITN